MLCIKKLPTKYVLVIERKDRKEESYISRRDNIWITSSLENVIKCLLKVNETKNGRVWWGERKNKIKRRVSFVIKSTKSNLREVCQPFLDSWKVINSYWTLRYESSNRWKSRNRSIWRFLSICTSNMSRLFLEHLRAISKKVGKGTSINVWGILWFENEHERG